MKGMIMMAAMTTSMMLLSQLQALALRVLACRRAAVNSAGASAAWPNVLMVLLPLYSPGFS
jgi:hypothetical protein